MDTSKFTKEIDDLKMALEYQIDIVLRVEDERLLLVKENKIYKDKIKELNQMLEKYIGFQQLIQNEKSIQTEIVEMCSIGIETENQSKEIILQDDLQQSFTSMNLSQTNSKSNTTLSVSDLKSIESDILFQAKNLLVTTNKYQANKLQQKMPQKNLKFCGDQYKENKQQQQQQQQQQQLLTQQDKSIKDTQVDKLSHEILKITKENQSIKLSQRTLQDNLKKQEKENQDLQKQLDLRGEMLERLRQENAEMGMMMNENKFKSIRVLDQELKKSQEVNKNIQKNLDSKIQESQQLDKELNQFRMILVKLTDQYEKLQKIESQRSFTIREDDQRNEWKLLNFEGELKIKQQTIDEFKNINEKLNQEIEYFRKISLRQKDINQKQEQDLGFFRELLIKNNILK